MVTSNCPLEIVKINFVAADVAVISVPSSSNGEITLPQFVLVAPPSVIASKIPVVIVAS